MMAAGNAKPGFWPRDVEQLFEYAVKKSASSAC